jgi:hypothetical protein
MSLLTIGHQFPTYRLTALIGGDLSKVDAQQPGDYFTTISGDDHPGKWRVVFFWPKDFTFVCPTEIATFGKLNDEFEDREAQILGSRSTANSCTSSGVHSTRTSSGCPSRCSRTSSGSSPKPPECSPNQDDVAGELTEFAGPGFMRFAQTAGVDHRSLALPLSRYPKMTGFTEASNA